MKGFHDSILTIPLQIAPSYISQFMCNAAVYVTLQPTLSTVRLSLRDPNRMGKTSDLKDYEDIRVRSN